MKVLISRFEENFAVCETIDREIFNIKKSKLPESAKEGDTLIIEGDNINIDTTAKNNK